MFYKIFKQRADIKKYFPRAERVLIFPFHNVYFSLKINSREHKIRIINFSSEGMGLFAEEFKKFSDINIGDFHKGFLFIKGRKYSVDIQIVHSTADIVGCSIVTNLVELQKSFIEMFYYELLGKQFFEVESNELTENSETFCRWWNGGENLDLKIFFKNESIDFFEIVLFDMVIHGSSSKSGKPNGVESTDQNSKKVKIKDKDSLIDSEHELNNENLIASLRQLFSNINDLEGYYQEEIIDCFQK